MLRVTPPGERLFTAGGEAFEAVLTNRLEHSEPRRSLWRVEVAHEVVLDKRRQAVERVQIKFAARIDNGVDCIEIRAAGEHRESPEHPLFGSPEQLVAPVDRAANRPVSLRNVAVGG